MRDRFDHTLEHRLESKADDGGDDAVTSVRRIELITGTGRRRRWSDDDKARIVVESLRPGANVSEVARRHGLSPQQLFGWRAKLRSAISASASTPAAIPTFAPVLVNATCSRRIPAPGLRRPSEEAPTIEITLGSAVVRVRGAVDARTLAAVLKVLRVLA